MAVSIEVFIAVLAAAAVHATWNAMAKGGGDPLVASALIAFGAAAVSLVALVFTGLPGSTSMPYVLASAAIHVAYFLLIGLAFSEADYSVIYPLYRGAAPLGTALIGATFLDERLGVLAWSGIVLLALGIVGLGLEALRRKGLNARAAGLAAVIAGVIMLYTIVDGLGARVSGDAIAYVSAMMALNGVLLAPVIVAMRGKDVVEEAVRRWPFALIGGLLVMLSYGTALWAMTLAPIGLVGALRETSVLFATLIAALMLKERLGPARWLAAATIVAGLVLIRLA